MPTATAVKVVDASALAAVVFGEPKRDEMLSRLADARLIAPALLAFEMSNVCLVKMRRHPDLRDGIRHAFHLADRYDIETLAVDHADVLALAEATGLTAYDASYLWLARRHDAELVTLDQRLAVAAATPAARR